MGRTTPKIAVTHEDLHPHLIHGSSSPVSSPKCHFDQFSRFCTVDPCDRQTDTYTTLHSYICCTEHTQCSLIKATEERRVVKRCRDVVAMYVYVVVFDCLSICLCVTSQCSIKTCDLMDQWTLTTMQLHWTHHTICTDDSRERQTKIFSSVNFNIGRLFLWRSEELTESQPELEDGLRHPGVDVSWLPAATLINTVTAELQYALQWVRSS